MSRPRNLLGTAALATFTAAALAVPLTAGPTAGAESLAAPIEEYVALGDSWSADVVLADTNGLPDSTHAPVDCAQSHTNYPKLLAKEHSASRTSGTRPVARRRPTTSTPRRRTCRSVAPTRHSSTG